MVYFDKTLTAIVWLPIIIGFAKLILGVKISRKIFIVASMVNIVLFGIIFNKFNSQIEGWQLVEHYVMLPLMGINYSLGLDGISLVLLGLSCFINLLINLSDWQSSESFQDHKAYLLILHGMLNAAIAATNAGLFWVICEMILIPWFFLINSSKNNDNRYVRFLLYSMLSSILLLIVIISLRKIAIAQGINTTNCLDFNYFYKLNLNLTQQFYLFGILFIGLWIKIPIISIYSASEDPKLDLPIIGSIFLIIASLSLAGLTFFRFLLPLTLKAAIYCSKPIILLSIVTIIYNSLVAIMIHNFKRLIMHITLIQAGLVMLGMFLGISLIPENLALAKLSFIATVLQLLSYALIVTGLCCCAEILFNNFNANDTRNIKGLIPRMPIFAGYFIFFSLAYLGFPGTSKFIPNFLILLISFKLSNGLGILVGGSTLLTIGYLIGNYKNLIFDNSLIGNQSISQDLSVNEKIMLGLISVATLLAGVYPQFLMRFIKSYVHNFMIILEARC